MIDLVGEQMSYTSGVDHTLDAHGRKREMPYTGTREYQAIHASARITDAQGTTMPRQTMLCIQTYHRKSVLCTRLLLLYTRLPVEHSSLDMLHRETLFLSDGRVVVL